MLLAAAACSSQPESTLAVDEAVRPLLWPEAKVMAGLNMRALRSSALYQRHRADLAPLYQQFNTASLGIDVERDVDRLTYASNGSDNILLLTGKLDRKRIVARWKSQGAKQTSFGNYTALERDGADIVFLSDRAVLAGAKPGIDSALAVQSSGKGEISEAIQTRVRGLARGSQLYLVSLGGLPIGNLPMRADTRSNLSNFVELISGVSLALKADAGSHLEGTLECVSAQGATRVNDALRGLIGLGRLSTKDNETDMLRIYDAIGITKDANAVRIKTDLSAGDTDRLVSMLNRFSNRR